MLQARHTVPQNSVYPLAVSSRASVAVARPRQEVFYYRPQTSRSRDWARVREVRGSCGMSKIGAMALNETPRVVITSIHRTAPRNIADLRSLVLLTARG